MSLSEKRDITNVVGLAFSSDIIFYMLLDMLLSKKNEEDHMLFQHAIILSVKE
jgi:hypothetical protein